MRLAAIDMSLTGSGIAHAVVNATVNGAHAVSLSKVGLPAGAATTGPLHKRPDLLTHYAFDLAQEITQGGIYSGDPGYGGTGGPTHVAIETPALSMSRGGVFERGFVWYWLVGNLLQRGIAVIGVDPGQIKLYMTGKGGASKGAVIDAVARRLPMFETGGDEDLADAAGAVALLADLAGSPLVVMPTTHRAALKKLTMPAVPGA